MQAGAGRMQGGYSVLQGMTEGEAYLWGWLRNGRETADPSTALPRISC
jgi:hypothetical protein